MMKKITTILAVLMFVLNIGSPALAEEVKPGQQGIVNHSAKTVFGSFSFSLDPEKSEVSQLLIHMDSFTCGGITVSADVKADSKGLWPVKDNTFTIDSKLSFYRFIIKGFLSPDTNKVSGTWEIKTWGSVCSGEWETGK